MSEVKRICIVGSGNWGSVIAKMVGNNVQEHDKFENEVRMYVYEEIVKDQKLTEIINTEHENIKYLPGHKIPPNVVAIPDVVEAAEGADILVFVVPHQFVRGLCKQLQGKVKDTAQAISLIKGFDVNEKGLGLISDVIREELQIPCAVLMGANIAPEVANQNFCEATIGCKDKDIGQLLKEVMETPYFRITVVNDLKTVEMCGALKNIVAVGAGFVDGLGFGDNTKAAVIRLGLMEMVAFTQQFYEHSQQSTFLESCGVADLVTTCYTGRNKRVAEAYVKRNKLKRQSTIEQLEQEMLNGQKLQGPLTASEVNEVLKAKNMEDRFPLFTAVHKICVGDLPATAFLDCLRNHPVHMTRHIDWMPAEPLENEVEK